MLALLLAVAISADRPSKGPTLAGVVQDRSGRPVPRATVFVRTAAPRKGVGVL
jgi:hypothetical protein